MFLTHLSLTHYRNYRTLEIDFQRPLALFQGQNAQGKTNLLEAIYFLSTTKPVHAQQEREIVDWQAHEEPIPYSRVVADVQFGEKLTRIEIILTPRGDGINYTKQVKINGVNKRSMDLLGLMPAVLFLPADIKLVDGSPGERRRYLDIALCQCDRSYCQALSEFQKVVTQRNSLLKQLREQNARPNAESTDLQLRFWDEKLIHHGSIVVAQRHHFVQQLEAVACERHAALSGEREELALYYLSSFNPGHLTEAEFSQMKNSPLLPDPATAAATTTESVSDSATTESVIDSAVSKLDASTVAAAYQAKLESRRSRELAAGSTLYGPHRDDLRIMANGRDLRTYGSRGQQRTAALALKLAELQVSTASSGRTPLLLLDDVMSELDEHRRNTLLRALEGVEQAIVTTTDWDDFSPAFRAQAQRFHVHGGTVVAVND